MRESPKHLLWKEEHVQSPAGKVFGWSGFWLEGSLKKLLEQGSGQRDN